MVWVLVLVFFLYVFFLFISFYFIMHFMWETQRDMKNEFDNGLCINKLKMYNFVNCIQIMISQKEFGNGALVEITHILGDVWEFMFGMCVCVWIEWTFYSIHQWIHAHKPVRCYNKHDLFYYLLVYRQTAYSPPSESLVNLNVF